VRGTQVVVTNVAAPDVALKDATTHVHCREIPEKEAVSHLFGGISRQ